MSFKINTDFAVETADRLIKSFAQGIIVYAGGSSAVLDAWSFSYWEALGTGLGMALMSILTSLASGSIFKDTDRVTPVSSLHRRASPTEL